jgi:hypothetical protein
MIYFDLHGVISDLSTAVFGFKPVSWNYKIDGENLIDKVESDLNLLESCAPTEYYDIISELQFIFILSAQPEHWRVKSDNWLFNHFVPERVFRRYVNSPQEKLAILKPGDMLVEDFPFFKDYSQIILIDRPYNQNVKTDRRVKTPAELREYIFKC